MKDFKDKKKIYNSETTVTVNWTKFSITTLSNIELFLSVYF